MEVRLLVAIAYWLSRNSGTSNRLLSSNRSRISETPGRIKMKTCFKTIRTPLFFLSKCFTFLEQMTVMVLPEIIHSLLLFSCLVFVPGTESGTEIIVGNGRGEPFKRSKHYQSSFVIVTDTLHLLLACEQASNNTFFHDTFYAINLF